MILIMKFLKENCVAPSLKVFPCLKFLHLFPWIKIIFTLKQGIRISRWSISKHIILYPITLDCIGYYYLSFFFNFRLFELPSICQVKAFVKENFRHRKEICHFPTQFSPKRYTDKRYTGVFCCKHYFQH